MTFTDQAVFSLIEDAALADYGSIVAESNLVEHAGWDSSSVVFFMGDVKGQLGLELAASDLRDCKTAADVLAKLRQIAV